MKRLGLAVMALAAVAFPAAAQQKLDERRPASKDGVVEIDNVSGSVTVTGWDRDEVAVTGTLGRGSERLEFTGGSGRTEVRVVLPHFARHVDGSDLEIKVPGGSRVEVNTVSAEIGVDLVAGPVRLESVSGRVKLGGSPREFEAKTVSGDIEITAAAAPGRASSVSGTIALARRGRPRGGELGERRDHRHRRLGVATPSSRRPPATSASTPAWRTALDSTPRR